MQLSRRSRAVSAAKGKKAKKPGSHGGEWLPGKFTGGRGSVEGTFAAIVFPVPGRWG